MDALDVALPPEIGTCKRRLRGEARETVFLIATGPGHPPAEERAALAVLQHLHTAAPIEWVFETLDSSARRGDVYVDQREIDVRPYRNFPDAEITKSIAVSMLDQKLGSAAWAFAVTSDPAARLQAFDDWHGWASHRDALRFMDGAAGRMESICMVLESLVPGKPEALETMTALMRLAWTSEEWRARPPGLPIDPAGLLAHLGDAAGDLTATAEFLTWFQTRAGEFYESGLARATALVDKALGALRRAGAARGAIVLGAAWIDSAAELLTSRKVGFVEIWPRDVRVSPMLDHAALMLNEEDDSGRKLTELFSGEKIRSRVEALSGVPQEMRRHWAGDWSAAGQGLRFERQLAKGEECARRALEIDPRWAAAWEVRGLIAYDQGSYRDALSFVEKAIALEPHEARYRELEAAALESLGRRREASEAAVRGIRLNPKSGNLWCLFGNLLHGEGKVRQACYCFAQGKALGEPAAADNWQMVCRSPSTRRDCPLAVHPWRLALGHRFRRVARKLGIGR